MSYLLNKYKSFLLYVSVGLSNTIIGLGCIYFFLNILLWNYFFATLFGYVIGFINGFVLNKKFTFKSSKKLNETFWKYTVIFIISYFSSYLSGKLFVLIFQFGISQPFLKNLSVLFGAAIYVMVGFIGNKMFTFNELDEKRN